MTKKQKKEGQKLVGHGGFRICGAGHEQPKENRLFCNIFLALFLRFVRS